MNESALRNNLQKCIFGRGQSFTEFSSQFTTYFFYCKAPVKRSPRVSATYRNIVGHNMLRAFGHRVATFCDMLGVVGSNLTIFKLTTVFVDTRLWKTKHPRKRFQNFRQSYVLLTDRIEIHQSQPLT